MDPSTKIENRELAKQADALWSSRDMTSSFTANAVQRTRKVTSNQAQAKSRSTGTNQQLCFYHRTFGEAARQCRQPCTWTGSDKAVSSVTAVSSCNTTGSLLFVYDSISKRQFLVDTGAEVSVLPATSLEKCTMQPETSLLAANTSSIRTYGT